MALSRIGSSADIAALFVRPTYAATNPRHGRQNVEQIHASVVRRYPEAPQLPLPSNVSEIFNTETSRFAPERARDIAAPVFLYNNSSNKFTSCGTTSSNSTMKMNSHLDSYDCFGAVSLHGSMQTNVPKPFCTSGKSNYLNMPGGQWARDDKYIAEDMRKSLFGVYQMRHFKRYGYQDLGRANALISVTRFYVTTAGSSSTGGSIDGTDKKTTNEHQDVKSEYTKREKLGILISEYGKTIFVFHIVISLMSFGISYALVSSGLDVTPIIEIFSEPDEEGESSLKTKIMSGSSTFLIAYGLHKLFAPVRLTATMGVAPLLVNVLRKKGILKRPNINHIRR